MVDSRLGTREILQAADIPIKLGLEHVVPHLEQGCRIEEFFRTNLFGSNESKVCEKVISVKGWTLQDEVV